MISSSRRGTDAGFPIPAIRCLLVAAALVLLTGCEGAFVRYQDPREQGQRLYAERNYAEAAGAFFNATKQDPRDYKSFYEMGVCYDAMQDYTRAVTAYQTGLQVMEVTYRGQEDRAYHVKFLDAIAIAVAKHDPKDAQLNALESKARSTNRSDDYYLVAKVYRYRGDADNALEDYRHGVMVDKKNYELIKECGLYEKQVGQGQQAISNLTLAYRLNDQDEQVITALRQLGVVPGPSLKEQAELAQPIVPKGPIPPFKENVATVKGWFNKDDKPQQPQPAGNATPAASVQAPRD